MVDIFCIGRLRPILKSIGFACFLASYVGAISACAIAYTGNMRTAESVFVVFGILSIVQLFFFWRSRSSISKKTANGFLVCYLMPLVFIVAVLVGHDYSYSIPNVAFASFELVVAIVNVAFWGIVSKEKQTNKSSKGLKRLGQVLAGNWYLSVLTAIIVIISSESFGFWVNWDSASYYKFTMEITAFSLSPADISYFVAAGHACYSFVFLYAIGYLLSPWHLLGCRLVGVAIWVASVVLLSKIIEHINLCSKILNYAISTVFAFTPYIIGPIYILNPEMLIVFAFLSFLLSYIQRNRVLQLLSLTILVFAKEIAVIYIIALALGVLIVAILHRTEYRSFDKWRNLLCQMLIFFLPCYLMLVHLAFTPVTWGKLMSSTQPLVDGQDSLNSFAVNKAMLASKLEQLFLTDFTWALVVMILGFGAYAVIKRRQKVLESMRSSDRVFVPLVCVYLAFCASQLFYVTYTFPRYIMLNAVFLSMVFAFVVGFCEERTLFAGAFAGILAVAMLVESFVTIDPVTIGLYKRVDTGNGCVYSNPALVAYRSNDYTVESGKSAEVMALSPYAERNRQWGYYGVLLGKALSTMGYKDGDVVVFPDMFNPISSGPFMGYSTVNYFDPGTERVYCRYGNDMDYSEMEKMSYVIAKSPDAISNVESNGRVFYLRFTFNPEYDDSWVLDSFDAVNTWDVEYRGWAVEVIELGRPTSG